MSFVKGHILDDCRCGCGRGYGYEHGCGYCSGWSYAHGCGYWLAGMPGGMIVKGGDPTYMEMCRNAESHTVAP